MYVDDMLVKSMEVSDHIKDLEEAYGTFRQHRMKMNLSKYVFGVFFGKFLGFLVTNGGIEMNLEKIKAIIEMKHLSSKKDV